MAVGASEGGHQQKRKLIPIWPKYWMQNPIPKAIRAALAQRFQDDFQIAATITIMLGEGECPETRADELRKWCGASCASRWKPLERWAKGAVRIGFESVADAVKFRLSH